MATENIDPKNTIIGVVGAGNMGSGIAQKYATEGFQVVVVDINEDAVTMGQQRVSDTLNEGVARKVFTEAKRDAILDNMTFTTDKGALKNAALVVEAIFENKEVKQTLFQELDGICGEDTILATNTSSFYVDDVAEKTTRPENVIGLHYFYHPAKNRLVEVIKGKASSDQAFEKAWAIQELSGKTPVDSKDRPGFIVNRFFVPWLNESMRLVEEGVANIATVEAAAKKFFKVGMGPFELMNVTGVPITLHAATTLGEELGPFYAPCDLIRPIVEAKENWVLDGDVDESAFDAIRDRLFGITFQIAAALVLDEEVCSLEDCDLGARVGLRWPKGPFEMMNDLGTDKALALVQAIADRYEDVQVPAQLGDQNGNAFSIAHVQSCVGDGVGYLQFNRPDAMNALNEDVVSQLGDAFAALANNDEVKGIVLSGRGKAFVAGADVKFFVKQMKKKDIDRIVDFAANGQKIFRQIDECPKPVVCQLDGLSLGGGSELALACDYIIATEKGSLGFPETGIGIYPGLGGTQRSARRVGVNLARWLVLSGETVPAQVALGMGLVDEVVSSNDLAEAVKQKALSGKTVAENSPPETTPQGFEDWHQVFAAPLDELLEGKVTLPEGDNGAKLQKTIKRLGFKAPIAMKAADELVRKSAGWDLATGLQAETNGLAMVFGSEDALTGMTSRRPEFQGK